MPAEIVLRCQLRDKSSSDFVLLDEQIGKLNREIRKQKQTEAALRQNQEILNTVINNATAVIYIKDLEGRYILINRHYEDLFNLKNDELKGKTDFDVFPPEIARKFQENDQEVIKTEAAVHLEEVAPHEDGLHTYLSIKFPLKDANHDVYAMCGISTDITPMKQAEEQVRQLNLGLEQRILERTRDLEASNRELESYSYSIAHDLRTPLRAIVSFSQILQHDLEGKLTAEDNDSLDRVVNAGKYMSELINDMLGMGQVSRMEMHRVTVDLSELVRSCIERSRGINWTNQVKIRIQDGIEADCDQKLMKIMLQNLLDNAYKYSTQVSEPVIEFGARQIENEKVYFIIDNGIGFDMRYAEKVFGAFQRLHGKDEYSGTGIGLATVQRIVHRHGGRIWAESEPGKGAAFYFTLKTVQTDPPQAGHNAEE